MTLEELREFLETTCKATNDKIKQYREKLKAGLPDDEAEQKSLGDSFCNDMTGATSFEYDNEKESIRIKVRGTLACQKLKDELREPEFSRGDSTLCWQQCKSGFDKVSRDLTLEELKKRKWLWSIVKRFIF